MQQQKQHILVIRLSAMGDVAMCVPVLCALIQQHPNVEVTVVSKAFFKPIFFGMPRVHFKAANINNEHKGVFGLYKLYKSLKNEGFDAVADLHNVIRSKILRSYFKMNDTKVAMIDKGRAEKKALTRPTNKVFKQLKTTHERYADVFRNLGYTIDLNAVELTSKQDLSNTIVGDKITKWIGVAPFAQHDGKKYPLDLMRGVLSDLNKQNVKMLLFGGGKHEIELLNQLEADFKNCTNLAGKLTFEQELKVISNLDVMLSMDSGNAHLAALFGVPTATIWGATHPYAGFAPFRQQANCLVANLKQYPKLPTSIYGNKVVEGYEDVMRSIAPEVVVEKVLELVGIK